MKKGKLLLIVPFVLLLQSCSFSWPIYIINFFDEPIRIIILKDSVEYSSKWTLDYLPVTELAEGYSELSFHQKGIKLEVLEINKEELSIVLPPKSTSRIVIGHNCFPNDLGRIRISKGNKTRELNKSEYMALLKREHLLLFWTRKKFIHIQKDFF
ncbi:hypothetical protein [Sphingobacterium sp. CZ-2]|uniref:hypothetical protein n=1 Tax=Sphingobacterium sp. CZ-2 TaxID=2557994 RepID=UPI00106F7E6F|nr:hypothetical protein [Sphingobacterium sp. CZ-2]QBR12248.1 hypothetical protein E3D81_08770 [Sphingobacterium sp. CZ-2]